MYLLMESELDKLELTELSALYHSLCNAKNSVTGLQNVNPVFEANQKSLLNMMISQMVNYANRHNYLISDNNLIIPSTSSSERGN